MPRWSMQPSFPSESPMYSVKDYTWMASNPIRLEANAAALRRAIRSGAVVIDIGSGTGIFAILSCR